jgi:Ca-activated chloride channel homolog
MATAHPSVSAVRVRRLRSVVVLALLALARTVAPASQTQNDPNRPPWAQKNAGGSTGSSRGGTANSSGGAAANSGSSSNKSNGSNNAGVPPGDPVPLVQPSLNSDPATTAGSAQESSNPRGRIRVSVNLVTVLANVLDDKNRPAADLTKEAFEVFEEGVEQKIDIFESETSQPLDLALMIDASLSAHKEFSFEQEAAAHFIRQVLRPKDSLAVFGFDETVTPYGGFTDNVTMLQDAVRKIPGGAGTSIYDALVLGSRALEKRGDDRRRVIILVTDGGETTSRYDFEAARRAAVRSGALLYTILIRPVKTESGRNTAGEHALETITDTTGGAMFFPDTPQELAAIFDQIDKELRTQYRLAYYPNPRGPANSYRNIEVKIAGRYHVRYRKTYLTGAQYS